MKQVMRLLKHLSAARWQVSRRLPQRSLNAITAAITASEKHHLGELRFVVEAGLDWADLLSGVTSRARALQVFSNLRIWDTEHNSGVLIYLLLADRKVEIVADRGIHKLVIQSVWQEICRDMEFHFRNGEFEKGVLQGIAEINQLLQQHFPSRGHKANELPDQPTIL